jgi:hypothetical protein
MIFSCPFPPRSAYEGANLLLHHHEKEVKGRRELDQVHQQELALYQV